VPNLQTIGSFAWLVPTFTFAACVIIVAQIAAGRGGRSSGTIAVVGIAASAVVGLLLFAAALAHGGHELAAHPSLPEDGRVLWAVTGGDRISFGWLIDPLTASMVAMVTIVCSMIFIYATGYMESEFEAYTDPTTGEVDRGLGAARYARFFAYVSLFATGMLGFVLSSNLLQAVVFWEIMGLCSFLLIGFWFHKPSAAAAAKKAFMTTRIGDTLMLVGVFGLYWAFGTLDYAELLSADAAVHLAGLGTIPHLGVGWATVLALLLFGGAVGKSAQFPLHVWLPDAMEGPTPVSALIHAATMVAAGVFLVARLYPLFNAGGGGVEAITPAMWVVAAVGAFTALFAATIAVAQFDVKRVLAYSTISQLGYMIMALGIGAWIAAVFHVLTHAFFKALLFLGSGSVIHGVEHGFHHGHNDHTGSDPHSEGGSKESQQRVPTDSEPPLDRHDPQDMRNMGGLRERMPITFWTFMAGTLALTGVPFFSGFWSKDEILADAWHKADAVPIAAFVWLMGTTAAFFTAFYMARQVFMVFFGKPRSAGAQHAAESGPAMAYPLVVLALFATLLGFVGVPETFPIIGPLLGNPMHHFLGGLPFGAGEFHALEFDALPALISIAAALGGWGVGALVYGRRPAAAGATDPLRRLGPLWRVWHRKYYVDELYSATIVRGSIAFASLNAAFDRYVIDMTVNMIGRGGELFSRLNGWVDTHIVDGVVNMVGILAGETARGLRSLQSGRVQQYILIVVLSMLALVGAYVF
jgi:NADH-quinone oxidoreductase subunit L